MAYRAYVEDAIKRFADEEDAVSLELGIQHEQQHQELLLTDILHIFPKTPSPLYIRRLACREPRSRRFFRCSPSRAAFVAWGMQVRGLPSIMSSLATRCFLPLTGFRAGW